MRVTEMIYRIVKGLVGRFPASKEESDPRRSSSPSRANCIEMLASASQGSGECPAWIIMELDASDKAEREPAYGEEKERS